MFRVQKKHVRRKPGVNEELNTHWFDLGSVQFSPVEHDGVDDITCPRSLDGGREHVQEVLVGKGLTVMTRFKFPL